MAANRIKGITIEIGVNMFIGKAGTKLLAFFTPMVGAMLIPVITTALLTLMIITVVLAPILSAVSVSVEAHPEAPTVSTEAFSKISEEMLKYYGIPYVWGGSSPESGFDCSGLVQYVYRNALGIELPHQSQSMCDFCAYVPEADAAQGDLVFFRGTSARTGNDIIMSPYTVATISFMRPATTA